MNQQQRDAQLAVQQLESKLGALTAAISGLVGRLQQTQGEEGVRLAKEQALTTAVAMSAPFKPQPDRALLEAIFDRHLKS